VFAARTVFGILAWRTADQGVKFQFRATSLYVQWLSGPSTYLAADVFFCPAPTQKLTVGELYLTRVLFVALRSLHLTQHTKYVFENRCGP
jgi:hypothetical protein